MSLQLWVLAIVLYILQQPINTENGEHRKFFPSVSEDITSTTFPLDLTTRLIYDIIIIKCPYSNYHHGHISDSFLINKDMTNSQLATIFDNYTFGWIPIAKKFAGFMDITCGTIIINNGTFSNKNYTWSYKINWKNEENYQKLVEKKKILKTVEGNHEQCNNKSKDVIIFSKDKNNNIVKINPNEKQKVYPKKKFYYFIKPYNSSFNVIEEPCIVLEAYYDCPKIKLLNHKIINIRYRNNILINIIKTNGKSKNIQVQLTLGRNLKYYSGETIIFSRMRYLQNGIEIIKNSNTSIKSEFKIKGYDLVKLEYKCPKLDKDEDISGVYYFGPNVNEHKIKDEDILYTRKGILNKPNCTIDRMNIGYLEKIVYKKDIIWLKSSSNDSITNIPFKKRGNFIFLEIINEHTTILKCIYHTPIGTITITSHFVVGIKKVVGQDAKGNILYSVVKVSGTIKKKEEENKSFYKKLTDKFDKLYADIIIIIISLLIIFVVIAVLVFLYYCMFKPWYVSKKLKRKNPNVYKFWKKISSVSFEKYCQHINNKIYIPKKLKDHTFDKIIEGGEEVDADKNDLFNDSLVSCYKIIEKKIKAHYVYRDSKDRIYILSDGPSKDSENSFWKMIYEENIGTVVAIIYDKKTDLYGGLSDKVYWTDNEHMYGDVFVKLVKKTKLNLLYAYDHIFEISRRKGQTKTIRIFHVYNWIENDIPQSDYHLINLYKEVSLVARNKNILVHSSENTGSRVYMFIYSVCIYDAMTSYEHLDNPFNVIKKIRDQRHGGYISSYEFAYVIKVLVGIFFKNGIIVDSSERRLEFTKHYDDYLYNFYTREAKMDDDLSEFLMFVNILDPGKMKEIECAFSGLGKMSNSDIKANCKLFYIALDNKYIRKVRYHDIECIDSTSVIIRGKNKGDVNGFIHANKFNYQTNDNKERKLILCQAPLMDTIDDMLDMIYRYKVSIVVILMRPEESRIKISKWIPYFPLSDDIFKTSNYIVTRTKYMDVDKNMISESEYSIHNGKDELFNFTILHYQGWPDKNIPCEHRSIYELYTKIMNIDTDNYIAIHCSGGIGRSGTLGLIIYLIDTINIFPSFDPIARLGYLRKHRYKAVQTYSQFVFALLVVFDHFKKKIDDMDPNAYQKFYNMARRIFVRDGCLKT